MVDEFNKLLDELDDNEWWAFVSSWLDTDYIIDIMSNWEDETKQEAVETIKKIKAKKQFKEFKEELLMDIEEFNTDILKDEFLKVADELCRRGFKFSELVEFLNKGERYGN
jgi:Mg/Co/Ni transporter MgtE